MLNSCASTVTLLNIYPEAFGVNIHPEEFGDGFGAGSESRRRKPRPPRFRLAVRLPPGR